MPTASGIRICDPIPPVAGETHLTDSAVAVYLKYVIHLVGDMHCPAHIEHTTHNMKSTTCCSRTSTPRDWLHESAVACEVQFEWAKPDERLRQDFLNNTLPLIESQIRNAGYRLARVLNELFG